MVSIISSLLPSVIANTYSLSRSTSGTSFFDDFVFQTFADPTHGTVNYVNQSTAMNEGLAYVSQDGQFVMSADSTRVVQPGQRGRDSIRIASKDSYLDSVMVLDLTHMPTGCATWPAWWTVTRGAWPAGGEIDIIEGVNTRSYNIGSLHTSAGCYEDSGGQAMTGTPGNTNCDAHVNYNSGCNVAFNKANNYGQPFNNAGGGWYAMRRSNQYGIMMWFWSRQDASVPDDVRDGSFTINPDAWGEPEAVFSPSGCDISSHFDAHEIVFDLTFCGDFAGVDYAACGCPGNCTDFVKNNPSAFEEAYWAINSLKTYV
ncbi:hypothetical protein FRB96_000874 [Tulasnella sp. 330]|nr:hypothetical protein FRB96_000874 [Tulasnella sp. 330]